jgi:2-methylcitrate dehydratase PrpD
MAEQPTRTTTDELVEYVQRGRDETLPAEVLEAAQKGVLDWLGTALAGSRESCGQVLAEVDALLGGNEQATLLGVGRRTSVLQAALVNGTAGHALDYDDTHLGAGLHATAATMPAVLALAEWLGASGRQLLNAYVVGFEIATYLGRMLVPSQLKAAWHPTAMLGTIGAAGAASALLRLDPDQTRMALGHAASQASGLRRNFGSMTKPFHAGKASSAGVLSALLAQRGFTAAPEALDGEIGFLDFLAAHSRSDRRFAEVRPPGQPFRILQNDFKLHACCHATHAAVDAMLALREQGLKPEAVEKVEVQCCPGVFPIASRPSASSGLEGKFSLGYCVSVALTEGAAGPDQFTDALVARPILRDLTRRVELRVDPAYQFKQALVRVRTSSGQQLERYVDAPRGSSDNPPSWDDLAAKFHALASAAITPDAARALEAAVKRLPELPSCEPLVRVAVPA